MRTPLTQFVGALESMRLWGSRKEDRKTASTVSKPTSNDLQFAITGQYFSAYFSAIPGNTAGR